MTDQNKKTPAMGEAQGGKPCICKVLGVEDMEPFNLVGDNDHTYRINEGKSLIEYEIGDGNWYYIAHSMTAFEIIFHPDRIIRKPRFTEEEKIALNYICKCFSARTGDELARNDDNVLAIMRGDEVVICLPRNLFSSLRPGQSVKLETIIG